AFDAYAKAMQAAVAETPTAERPNWYWLSALPIGIILITILLLKKRRGSRLPLAISLTLLTLAVAILGTLWPLIAPGTLERLDDARQQSTLALDRASRTERLAAALPAAANFITKQQLLDALV